MSDLYARLATKKRHEKLRSLGACINGPVRGSISKRTGRYHGAIFKGGRCFACWEQKLGGDVTRYWQAKARSA